MDLDTALTGKPAEGASATEILRADHREAERLFAEFEQAGDDEHAARVVAQTLCLSLELHDTIEKEVFYPAVVEIDPGTLENAFDAHASIETVLEELRRRADANEPLGDTVSRLKGIVTAHVEEEERRLFPHLEAAVKDSLRELGTALIKRKEELTGSTRSLEGPAT